MRPAHKPMLTKCLACLLAAGLFAPITGFPAEDHPPQPGEVGWQRAVRLRNQLESSPVGARTAERFQEVMDAFRQIYRLDPNIPRAPAAVAAVADLLVERGRLLHETGSLRAALLQYELLRKQYPKSEQVRMALLLEAEVCRQDLKDLVCAEQKLRAVMAAYPGTSFAEQAEIELHDLSSSPPGTNNTRQTPAPETTSDTSATEPVPLPAPHKSPPVQRRPVAQPVPPPTAPEDSSAPSDPSAVAPAYDPAPIGGPVVLNGIRHWSNRTSTRIAIDLSGKVSYETGRVSNPDRIYFDLQGAHLSAAMRSRPSEQIDDGFLKRIRSAQFKGDVARVVLDVNDVWEYSAFLLPNPWRLIIDVHGSIKTPGKAPMSGPASPAAHEPGLDKLASRQDKHVAPPPRKPRIVIDAGHGGRDSGTLGAGGIEEKDVVLDVALRTGALLQNFGAEVVYTRGDDTFVPLEARTDIANKAQADLFLSIHGNSSPASSARGVETYYLNSSARGEAVNIAARENALSNYSVQQLSEMVHKITLKEKIEQSRRFAVDVDEGLFAGLKQGNPGLRDRGAKRAPFVVLIGAQMPSVLAEISFLTNPQDAGKLAQPAYRQRIAASLAAGVEQYLKSLKPAPPPAKPESRAEAKPTRKPHRNPEIAQETAQRAGN